MLQANYFKKTVTVWLSINVVMKDGKRAKMGAKGVLSAARAHGFQVVQSSEDDDQYTIYPELVAEQAPTPELMEPEVEPSPFDFMTADEQSLFNKGITLLGRYDADTAVAAAFELDLDSLNDWLYRIAGDCTTNVTLACRQSMIEWQSVYEELVFGDDIEPVVEPAPVVLVNGTESKWRRPMSGIHFYSVRSDAHVIEVARPINAIKIRPAYNSILEKHGPPPVTHSSVLRLIVEITIVGDTATVLMLNRGEYITHIQHDHKFRAPFWQALRRHGFSVIASNGYGTCRAFHKGRYDQYLAQQPVVAPTIAVSPPPEGWVHVTSTGYWIALPGTKGRWHGFTKKLRRRGYNMAHVVKWLKEHGLRVTHKTPLDVKLVGDLSKVT